MDFRRGMQVQVSDSCSHLHLRGRKGYVMFYGEGESDNCCVLSQEPPPDKNKEGEKLTLFVVKPEEVIPLLGQYQFTTEDRKDTIIVGKLGESCPFSMDRELIRRATMAEILPYGIAYKFFSREEYRAALLYLKRCHWERV